MRQRVRRPAIALDMFGNSFPYYSTIHGVEVVAVGMWVFLDART